MTGPDWEATSPYPGPPHHAPPPQYAPPQYAPPQYAPPPQQWAPPSYGPPQPWAPPPYGQQPPYAPPPYGHQPPAWAYPPAPRGPQRPGPVIAAAVFAFVSAVLVLVGTLYGAAFGALLTLARGPDSGMPVWFALLQVALAGLLVVGGIRVLSGDRRWLLGAAGAQLALCLWWYVALDDVATSVFQDSVRVLPLVYGVLALLAGGLTSLPDARTWTARPAAPAGPGG
ncbi:hypothetical protein [Modestobacter versicolor]|uniref:hypothetical protein n=1 Tax=Modestobacter versicolor TaxID=429133 RepID=UPI0034DE7C43